MHELRNQDVLILASGNIVHNLGMISWDGKVKEYDWTEEFDSFVKQHIVDNNPTPLINYQTLGSLATIARSTNEHYLPLMNDVLIESF